MNTLSATNHPAQLSLTSSGVGFRVAYPPAWLELWRGTFTRVGWQVRVTLCDPVMAGDAP